MKLSDINNKTISLTLTDFELATPEDNTPEKLTERAMSDNKIQASINGDNIELKDDTYQYVSIPISEWQELKDAVDAKLHDDSEL